MNWVVATFYKFVALPDCAQMRSPLLNFCQEQDIRGTILLAQEGINGTIASSRAAIDEVLNYLRSDDRLSDLEAKESVTDTLPFERMKVKVKQEIVTLGMPEVNPSEQAGTYVDPQDWNQLITDPEVIVIDTRNSYEVKIGTFQNAKNPETSSFRDFPAYVQNTLNPATHPKVAMFCTGGIRCEKASAYMLSQGYREVYHLKGGILKYLEEVAPEESLWQGECFVFDQRVALQHGLEPGTHEMCLGCGHPISEAEQNSPAYEVGVSCPHCIAELTEERRSIRRSVWQSRQANLRSNPYSDRPIE